MSLADRMWVNVVARNRGYDPDVIRGPSRNQEDVEARRNIAVVLDKDGWGLSRIARALKKHHTSVLWMLRGGRKTR